MQKAIERMPRPDEKLSQGKAIRSALGWPSRMPGESHVDKANEIISGVALMNSVM